MKEKEKAKRERAAAKKEKAKAKKDKVCCGCAMQQAYCRASM